MSPRQQHAAWAAVTVLGVLLTFAPATVGLRTLSQRDTDRLYAPIRTLVVEALREGRLPLWNPYEATGKPLFAEGIHSVLHPVSLAGALLAPSSVDFLILGYLTAAAVGAFLLALTLGGSPPASAGAGLAFALSGFSVSMTGNLVFLAGLSTLPWLVAAARTAGAGGAWGPVLTALATSSAFFSGDAQVGFVALALGLLLAADAGGWRGAARALAGMVPGLLLAGVQINATREFLPLTFRGLGLDEGEKTRWSLAPARLLEWILPGLFRGPPAEIPRRSSGDAIEAQFSESLYLGAPLLFAAAFGALRAGRRTAIAVAGAGAVLLWLAFGHHLGARQLLDGVPVWNRFRYAEKLMAPLTLCLCALGALGIDAFAAGRLPTRWTRPLAAVALAAGAALALLHAAPGGTLDLATRLLGETGAFHRSTLAAGLPHLLVALAALLAVDRWSPARWRAPALASVVALASAAAVFWGAHLGSPDARRFATPMRLESDSPVPRLAHPDAGLYDERRFPDYLEWSAELVSLSLLPSLNVAQRVDAIGHYGGFNPSRLTLLAGSLDRGWLHASRRFGLTHVVLPIPRNELHRQDAALAVQGGQVVQRAPGVELWTVPHRPWTFFARRAGATLEPKAARDGVAALIAQGDDGSVIVEAPAPPPPVATGRVLAVERRAESLRIDAESVGPALLVVQDAFWPGWRATIDGREAEILAADALVRAVRWPAGLHRLEMVYDPPELRVGLALTTGGAVLTLLLAALALRRASPRP